MNDRGVLEGEIGGRGLGGEEKEKETNEIKYLRVEIRNSSSKFKRKTENHFR